MSRVEPLVLQVKDGALLREWTRSSSISAGLAQGARILVLAAAGHSNTEIGRLVGVGRVVIPRRVAGPAMQRSPHFASVLSYDFIAAHDLSARVRPGSKGTGPDVVVTGSPG